MSYVLRLTCEKMADSVYYRSRLVFETTTL